MPNNLDYQPEYRRNLPHIQPEGATLFITARLAGSLPPEAIQRLRDEQTQRVRAIEEMTAPDEGKRQHLYDEDKRYFGRYDALLDQAADGPTWLGDPRVAALVCEAIHYRDDRMYVLGAYCVMPNHIHLVATPLERADGAYHALSKNMHGLKGYTAREANLILGREGAFWQHENYDHYARDGRETERIIAYVLNNPVKAGLAASWEEWPWSYWRRLAS